VSEQHHRWGPRAKRGRKWAAWAPKIRRRVFGRASRTDSRTKKITAYVVAVQFRMHVFAVGDKGDA